jgi:hypothetical protein
MNHDAQLFHSGIAKTNFLASKTKQMRLLREAILKRTRFAHKANDSILAMLAWNV